ncbi:hypothetical protein BGZ59_000134, partial [Podila verticillata]
APQNLDTSHLSFEHLDLPFDLDFVVAHGDLDHRSRPVNDFLVSSSSGPIHAFASAEPPSHRDHTHTPLHQPSLLLSSPLYHEFHTLLPFHMANSLQEHYQQHQHPLQQQQRHSGQEGVGQGYEELTIHIGAYQPPTPPLPPSQPSLSPSFPSSTSLSSLASSSSSSFSSSDLKAEPFN